MLEGDLREKIEKAINSVSAENDSNTPDFILASFLMACLTAFDSHVRWRDKWYGVQLRPAAGDGKKCAHSPPDPAEPTVVGQLSMVTGEHYDDGPGTPDFGGPKSEP